MKKTIYLLIATILLNGCDFSNDNYCNSGEKPVDRLVNGIPCISCVDANSVPAMFRDYYLVGVFIPENIVNNFIPSTKSVSDLSSEILKETDSGNYYRIFIKFGMLKPEKNDSYFIVKLDDSNLDSTNELYFPDFGNKVTCKKYKDLKTLYISKKSISKAVNNYFTEEWYK